MLPKYHRVTFYVKKGESVKQLFQQPDIITTSIDEVSTTTKPLVKQIRKLPQKLKKLMEMLPHQEAGFSTCLVSTWILSFYSGPDMYVLY